MAFRARFRLIPDRQGWRATLDTLANHGKPPAMDILDQPCACPALRRPVPHNIDPRSGHPDRDHRTWRPAHHCGPPGKRLSHHRAEGPAKPVFGQNRPRPASPARTAEIRRRPDRASSRIIPRIRAPGNGFRPKTASPEELPPGILRLRWRRTAGIAFRSVHPLELRMMEMKASRL